MIKRFHEFWTLEKLYDMRDNIQFPEYQREPNVWDDEKRAKLIDSIIKNIPIPSLFLFKQDDDSYDCIDGQQRIQSIIAFFDGDINVEGYGTIDEFRGQPELISKVENYEFSIIIIESADEEELRDLFLRLQLGTPLNAGEKLKAATGEMRDFVFDTAKENQFIKNISIPARRYSKEQVLAKICLNSFSLQLKGTYKNASYKNLLAFFEQFDKLDRYKDEINLIEKTLDTLNLLFAEKAKLLKNRALVVSAYLFVEKLIKENREPESKLFSEFYLKFIEILNREASEGLDYNPEYRTLMEFQKYVIQAAFSPSQLKKRDEILVEYFEYWKTHKEIKKDQG